MEFAAWNALKTKVHSMVFVFAVLNSQELGYFVLEIANKMLISTRQFKLVSVIKTSAWLLVKFVKKIKYHVLQVKDMIWLVLNVKIVMEPARCAWRTIPVLHVQLDTLFLGLHAWPYVGMVWLLETKHVMTIILLQGMAARVLVQLSQITNSSQYVETA